MIKKQRVYTYQGSSSRRFLPIKGLIGILIFRKFTLRDNRKLLIPLLKKGNYSFNLPPAYLPSTVSEEEGVLHGRLYHLIYF
jgi:hypothetical protein